VEIPRIASELSGLKSTESVEAHFSDCRVEGGVLSIIGSYAEIEGKSMGGIFSFCTHCFVEIPLRSRKDFRVEGIELEEWILDPRPRLKAEHKLKTLYRVSPCLADEPENYSGVDEMVARTSQELR